LLRGEEVTHHGLYHDVDGVTLAPVPDPPVPIWIGGTKPRVQRRAAKWDGWMPDSTTDTEIIHSPERLASDIAYIHEHRTSDEPFEVAFSGYSRPDDREMISAYAAAGATWWLESIHGRRGSLEEMMARLEAGPVRL